MVNPEYDILKDWMFGKLNSLLENLDTNPNYPILKLSLGEPTLSMPEFVKSELSLNYNDWGRYPPSLAIPRLSSSIMKYIEKQQETERKAVGESSRNHKNAIGKPNENSWRRQENHRRL